MPEAALITNIPFDLMHFIPSGDILQSVHGMFCLRPREVSTEVAVGEGGDLTAQAHSAYSYSKRIALQ
jgi:hypothetical protein